MNSADYATLASVIGLFVTILGWFLTFKKQTELEHLKGDIAQIISEHDTRFAYLHECRGKVIDELYKHISKMERTLNHALLVPIDGDPEALRNSRENSHKALYELIDYFQDNRLYLDDGLCQKVDRLIQESGAAVSHTEISPSHPEIVSGYRHMATIKILENISPLRRQIEDQMRKLLDG